MVGALKVKEGLIQSGQIYQSTQSTKRLVKDFPLEVRKGRVIGWAASIDFSLACTSMADQF
jgi:hypothetical protein